MKMQKKRIGTVVAALAWIANIAPLQGLEPLKEGDRIVCFGDSITQEGDSKDTGYVRLLRLKASAKKIEVIGGGIAGNKVADLQKRLEKDVLSHKPSLVVIYIGVNDAWHWMPNQKNVKGGGTSLEDYSNGLKDLISKIKAANAQVVLCTPGVIGENTQKKPPELPPTAGPQEKMISLYLHAAHALALLLDQYADASKAVAKETGVELVDLHQVFLCYLKDNNPANLYAGVLTRDGVHLGDEGNKMVANTLATALGL